MTFHAMQPAERKSYFLRLKELKANASSDYRPGMTPTGEGMLARIIPQKEADPVFIWDPYADRNDRDMLVEFLARGGIEFLFDAIEDLGRRLRQHEPAPKEDKPKRQFTNANQAGALCKDHDFQRYMRDVHQLENADDFERVKSRVRTMCGIDSLNDLNDNNDAWRAFKKLRGKFEAWRGPKL